MAGWDDFPLAVPAAPAADPWAAFPKVEEPPTQAAPGTVADFGINEGQARSLSPAAPQPEPSLIDRIMDYGKSAVGVADQGVRGAAEGMANLVGLPVDLVDLIFAGANLGLNAVGAPQIPRSETPFMGSKSIKRSLDTANDMTADALGVERPDRTPDNVVERVANRTGQEIGAMFVPTAGILGKAATMTAQEARQASPIARTFLEPAVVDPKRFARRETEVATGAGLGASGANELTNAAGYDKDGWVYNVADIMGAIFGAGVTGTGRYVANKGGEVINALRGDPNYADDVVREAVADRLGEAAGLRASGPGLPVDTTSLVDLIMNGNRVDDVIPNFQESLADRTKNPGLAALEYSRQSGPNSGQFTQRRAENTQAVDAAMASSEPQGNAGALRSELELERDRRLGDAASLRQTAQDEAATAVAPLQPQGTPAVRGNTVRSALEDQREAARARTEEAYAAANIGDVQVDPARLSAALDGVTQQLSEVERGLVPQGVIDRVGRLGASPDANAPVDTGLLNEFGAPITRDPAPPAPVSMKEATDLRSELQRLQRAALADPKAERGGRNAARVLGQYIDAVDNFIAGSLSPEQRQALEAARGAKFDEAEAFTRRGDPVAAALGRYEGGQPRMSDERVAGAFTSPQAMDRLFAQADTPETRAAIRDELLAGADTSTAEGIRRFVQENAEQLRRFPGLGDELDRAVTARTAESAAVTAESDLLKQIGPQGKSVVAKYLQYGDENADRAMRTVLASKEPGKAADELLSFVNDDPKAVEGARKVFWDILQKSARRGGETTADLSGSQPWMPRAMQAFIDDPRNAAVAERLYRDNPEHWANIKQITEALQGVDLRNRAKAPNTSGTAQGVNPIMTPETLQSRYYAFSRGQISGSFLATSIAAVAGRRAVARARTEAIGRMLDEALLNPEAAAILLKENNPANRAALARNARLWLGNQASTFVELVTPEAEDDELKGAVMRDEK